MGFDLAFSLSRREPLSASELDILAEHLRAWRGKIIGYDWHVPREAPPGAVIAWGTLRPTRGMSTVSDRGGFLEDVIEHLHEAMADVRDLIRGASLAFGDDFGALAWIGTSFTYRKDAQEPQTPIGDAADVWVSLAATRGIPDGKAATDSEKAARAGKPTTKAAAAAAVAQLDRAALVSMVLAPLNSKKVSDRERTAAIEALGRAQDPEAAAVIVQRVRNDGHARPWSAAALRALAAAPRRCPWATALLALDRDLRGATELLVATATDDAVPHLLRLRVDPKWTPGVMRALAALDTDRARAALEEVRLRLDAFEPSFGMERTTALLAEHRPELWQIEADWLARFGY